MMAETLTQSVSAFFEHTELLSRLRLCVHGLEFAFSFAFAIRRAPPSAAAVAREATRMRAPSPFPFPNFLFELHVAAYGPGANCVRAGPRARGGEAPRPLSHGSRC